MWALTIVALAGGIVGWILFDIISEVLGIWRGK
jgi:uncharacterized membrane protein YuzA (DUF378 family)